MHVEAVLFDLFNTLVLLENEDDFYTPSLLMLHQSLKNDGVSVSFDEFQRVYFEVRDELYSKAHEKLEEPHFNVRISQTLNRFGYSLDDAHHIVMSATEAFSNEFLKYVRPDPNVFDVLQKLRQKYRVGLISNFAIPELVQTILNKFRLRELFDVIVISGDVNKRKPSPEIFQKALEALGTKASEAVYVGDTLSMDVHGAKNSGMKAILIYRKVSSPAKSTSFVYKPKGEQAKIAPDNIIESLKQLPGLLEDC